MNQPPRMIRTRDVRHEFGNVSPPDDKPFRQDPETLRRKLIVDALSWAAQQCNASKRELIEVLSDSKLKQATKAGLSESDIERQAGEVRQLRGVAKQFFESKRVSTRMQVIEFCRENPDLSSGETVKRLGKQGVKASTETILRAKRFIKTGVWSRTAS